MRSLHLAHDSNRIGLYLLVRRLRTLLFELSCPLPVYLVGGNEHHDEFDVGEPDGDLVSLRRPTVRRQVAKGEESAPCALPRLVFRLLRTGKEDSKGKFMHAIGYALDALVVISPAVLFDRSAYGSMKFSGCLFLFF